MISWTPNGTATGYWIYYNSAHGENNGSAGPISGTYKLDNLLGLDYNYVAEGSQLPSVETAATFDIPKINTFIIKF